MHKAKKGATDVSFHINRVGEHKGVVLFADCSSSVVAGSSSAENRKNEHKTWLHLAIASPGLLQFIFSFLRGVC